MNNDLLRSMQGGPAALDAFAPGVARLPIIFVNAYLVGEPRGPWILVDTGLPASASRTRAAVEARFGAGARPEAIVLTHGHFDHAGSARALADAWDVPIYAHPLEMPYLTGRSSYPPQDPTIGGAISFMSRAFPHSGFDFGNRVRELPTDGSVPGAPGWRWLHTPGHTAGHISLFRDTDATLLAGDALTTMDLDSWGAQITRARDFDRPPAPMTPDWQAARRSLDALVALEPTRVAAGHGVQITDQTAERLRAFAARFAPPPRGRYVPDPARMDERGVVALPPPVPDPLPGQLAVGALAALALVAVRRRR